MCGKKANVSNETLTTIFIIVTAVAVSMQALILLGLFIAVRKSVKAIHSEVEQLRTTATPILNHTKDFVTRVTPKLDAVAGDMVEMSRGLRTQTLEFQAAASDILDRVQRQTGRVDTMFTSTLDRVDKASTAVNDAVTVPLKHLSGITAFAKAAIESLRSTNPKPRTQPTHSAADKDLFV
jgi:phage-related tail protein